MHSANSWATGAGRRHFPPALKEQSCDFDLWFFLKLPPFICANGGEIAYKYLPFHFGLDTAESNYRGLFCTVKRGQMKNSLM
jgi:hypothetical protein